MLTLPTHYLIIKLFANFAQCSSLYSEYVVDMLNQLYLFSPLGPGMNQVPRTFRILDRRPLAILNLIQCGVQCSSISRLDIHINMHSTFLCEQALGNSGKELRFRRQKSCSSRSWVSGVFCLDWLGWGRGRQEKWDSWSLTSLTPSNPLVSPKLDPLQFAYLPAIGVDDAVIYLMHFE